MEHETVSFFDSNRDQQLVFVRKRERLNTLLVENECLAKPLLCQIDQKDKALPLIIGLTFSSC